MHTKYKGDCESSTNCRKRIWNTYTIALCCLSACGLYISTNHGDMLCYTHTKTLQQGCKGKAASHFTLRKAYAQKRSATASMIPPDVSVSADSRDFLTYAYI